MIPAGNDPAIPKHEIATWIARLADGDQAATEALNIGLSIGGRTFLYAARESGLRGKALVHAFHIECKGGADEFVDLIRMLASAGGAR